MSAFVIKIYDFIRTHKAVGIASLVVATALLCLLCLRVDYKEQITDFLPLDGRHGNAMRVYQQISGADKIFVLFEKTDSNVAQDAAVEEADGTAEEYTEMYTNEYTDWAADESAPDEIIRAVEEYMERLHEADTAGLVTDVAATADMERFAQTADFVYDNIPYFLTDEDYARFDSLLSAPESLNAATINADTSNSATSTAATSNSTINTAHLNAFVAAQLRADKQMLMMPSGGMMAGSVARDPLSLFRPVMQSLQSGSSELDFELYDGYLFTPDMRQALVVITSPFGASETNGNARLAHLLRSVADSVAGNLTGCETNCETGSMTEKAASVRNDITISVVGGPIIAVENADQIKSDSILTVAISVTLILALLFYAFRNVRNLLLIAVSIGWGWLFGLGCLSLVHSTVSVIVIGISSIVLGIAVNYPLHLIAHMSHAPDRRSAVREIVGPLVVGNITTVGAFMALVPLRSAALRDLGLFASFLLAGTIIFVLLYLPHAAKAAHGRKTHGENAHGENAHGENAHGENAHGESRNGERYSGENRKSLLDRLAGVRLEEKRWLVWTILLLTPVLGYFSLDTKFDANMSNINYMTAQQRDGMAGLQSMMRNDATQTKLYVVSTAPDADSALDESLALQPLLDSLRSCGLSLGNTGCSRFLCSGAEQSRRLERWHAFCARYAPVLIPALQKEAAAQGFNAASFEGFCTLLRNSAETAENIGTTGAARASRATESGQPTRRPIGYFAPLTETVLAGYLAPDSAAGLFNVVDVMQVRPANVDSVKQRLAAAGAYAFDVAGMNSAIANNLTSDFNYIGLSCGAIVFLFLWLSFGNLELALISFVPMAVSWVWILGIMGLMGIQFNIVNIILATFIFGQGDDYTIFMTEGAMYEYAHRRRILGSYKSSIIVSALVMFIGIGTLILARHPALHSLAEVTIVGMASVVVMAYVFPPLIFNFLVRTRSGYRRRPLSIGAWLHFEATTFLFRASSKLLWLCGFGMPKRLKTNCPFRLLVHHTLRSVIKCGTDVRLLCPEGKEQLFGHGVLVVSQHLSPLRSLMLMLLDHRLVPLFAAGTPGSALWRHMGVWMGGVSLSDDYSRVEEHVGRLLEAGFSLVVVDDGAGLCRVRENESLEVIAKLSARYRFSIVAASVFGAEEVFAPEARQIFSGQVRVVVGERFRTSQAEVMQNVCRTVEERAQQTDASFYAGLVADRYRYKGAAVFKAVRRHTEGISVPDDYGAAALTEALMNPHKQIEAVVPDQEHADILLSAADGVAPNLRVNIRQ